MNICILNHGLASGGTDSFVLNLVRGLIHDGHNVTIALAVNPESGKQFREDEAREMGATIVKLSDLGSVRDVLRYALRLYKFLKAGHFDVFHANMDLFNGINMFVAWLAKVPVRVCHSHNSQSQYEQQSGKHLAVKIYRSIMRRLLWRFSTARCGCSAQAMEYLFCKKWRADKSSQVVYNGIDLARFRLSGSEIRRSQKKIITVGRISAQKNPHFIVRIMAALHAIDSTYTLDWVGNGELKDEIQEEIHRLGLEQNITMLGAQKNIPELLNSASIFLFPSIFEGLGIALIEAQAAGLSCLVSDRVPNEVDAGKCHFMSIDIDPKCWAEKIILLSNDKNEIDSTKLSRFDVKNMVCQMEKIYGC